MAFDPNNAESNKIHNLDDVNDRLYRRDLADRKPRHIDSLHGRNFGVKREWAEKAEAATAGAATFAAHPSFFRKFFYFALGFAALAIVIVAITFLTGGNTVSNNNIEINILGNSFARGGEELPLQAEIVNKNASELELVDLFVEYDKGGDATSGATHVRDLTSFGTIGAGKTVHKSFFITLFGQEGSTKNIDFTLQYRLHGSNAIFIKKATFAVTINSAPVSLSVEAPQNLTPNQELTLKIKTKSNSENPLSGMLLVVQYPNGFKFKKSVPEADAFDNVWKLGDLAPGAEREIAVTGTVYGTDGEDRAFHIYTGAASADDATKIGVTYNSLLSTVSLVRPFIAAHIMLNGSNAETTPVSSSGTIQGQVSYSNNMPTPVANAQVTLKLSGNALDTSTVVVPNGFYDSARNTITWDSTTYAALANLQPGDNGTLGFTFKALPLVSGGATLSSPSIKLSVSIKGKQSSDLGGVSEVTDFEERTAVVSSDLGFSASVAHTTGPFTNTGPVPPKANQPTTYTITWGVTSSANMLTDAGITATLPTYVDWVGTIAPAGSPIAYDETTRTIRWTIGQIPAGTGVSAPARTVSFQVRLNPSTSQTGTVPKLVLDTLVSARDTFTGQTLSLSRSGVSAAIPSEGASGAVGN
jgi:hypothetical protein